MLRAHVTQNIALGFTAGAVLTTASTTGSAAAVIPMPGQCNSSSTVLTTAMLR